MVSTLYSLSPEEIQSFHNISCLPDQFGHASKFLMNFGKVSVGYIIFILLSGLLLWFLARKQLFLQRRNPSIVAFLALPLIMNIFCNALFRAKLNDPDSVLLDCTLVNFAFIMVIPTQVIPNMVRIYLYKNRCNYSRLKAETLSVQQSKAPESMGSFTTESFEHKLDKLKIRCTTQFGRRLTVLGLFVSGVICLIFSILMCPSKAFHIERCEYFNLTDTLSTIFIVPCALLVIIYLYQLYSVRNEPDPFLIRRELFHMNLIFVFIGFPSLFLSVFNPFDLQNDDEELKFRWAFFIDISLVLAFLNSVHVQVILSLVSKHKAIKFGMWDVFHSETGLKLFESFLIGEYSVENLSFYLSVKRWKEHFETSSTSRRTNEAKNIFRWYVANGGIAQINISSELRERLEDTFEKLRTQEIDLDITLFDEVQLEVYKLMEADSFTRFVFTKLYKEFVGLAEPGGGSSGELGLSI